MNKTIKIERRWYEIDASGKILGKLATEAARLLMGKNKPVFTRHLDLGDYVIITNAARVRLTGKKMKEKVYFRHSGYPGGLRSITAEKLLQTQPTKLVEKAVKGMLPQNRLGRAMAKKLNVYAGETHPHHAQLMSNSTKDSPKPDKERARIPAVRRVKRQQGGTGAIVKKGKAQMAAAAEAKSQRNEKATVKKGEKS